MLASLRWNSLLSSLSLAALITGVSGGAQAQLTTRTEVYAPPSVASEMQMQQQAPAPTAIPAPAPAPTQAPGTASPEFVEPPAYNQPFGTGADLPTGYKPSRSALDPVETEGNSNADPYDPASSALPPDFDGESEAKPKVKMDTMEAGPLPPDIIRATPDPRIYKTVKLQGLDKVTARRQQIQANLGTVTSFGNLEIVPRACWQSPVDEQPDAAALLEIWQWKPGEKPSFVFFGWMYASSPGLSSLEHPVYDITVLGCLQDPKEEKAYKKKLEEEAKAEAAAAKAKAKKEEDEAAQRAKEEAFKKAQEASQPVVPDAADTDSNAIFTTKDAETETVPLLKYPDPKDETDINAPQPD